MKLNKNSEVYFISMQPTIELTEERAGMSYEEYKKLIEENLEKILTRNRITQLIKNEIKLYKIFKSSYLWS